MNNINIIKYISSSLEVVEEKKEERIDIYKDNIINNQLLIDDKLYTALTPSVYGWLRQQMEKAHMAYQSGKLAEDHWDTLRERFYPLHDWAIETYGKQAIVEAINMPQKNPFLAKDKSTNEPAIEHRWPTIGEYSHLRPVTPAAVAQVDAIRDEAIRLGWTEKRLYQNRGHFSFPYGQDYGLVCFIDKGNRIGKIARQSIEIIGPPPHENRLRFYNHDVDQPWVKKKQVM